MLSVWWYSLLLKCCAVCCVTECPVLLKRGVRCSQRAVMIDGTFDPLDMMFSETEIVTPASKGNKLKYGSVQLMILRSTPVGQYLQPTGNWQDGLVPAHLLPIRLDHSQTEK